MCTILRIISFQQAVECCNWCWILNNWFLFSCQGFIFFELRHPYSWKVPQNAKFGSIQKNNSKNHLIIDTNFNIQTICRNDMIQALEEKKSQKRKRLCCMLIRDVRVIEVKVCPISFNGSEIWSIAYASWLIT